MLQLLLVLPSLAAPPGYTVVPTAGGCELSLGPADPDDVVPMHARCTWPDVALTDLDALLSAPEDADQVWSRVSDARLVAEDGDTVRVWQRHGLQAMPDREVLLDWRRTPTPGGVRFDWAVADADWAVLPGNERCDRYDGFWEVTARGDGVTVVHETRYDPGSFPSWLVRPFLGGQLAALTSELRAAAGS